MSGQEPAVIMDFGPWKAEIVGPHIWGRFGYEVTLSNNWMALTRDIGGWWAWTHHGARRKARRLVIRQNRADDLRDNPEVVR